MQLRGIAKANAGRSSRQALAANLMLLRSLGVDEESLDLVVAMVLVQNVDEEMTAAVNYLASGFLLALLTLREEVLLARSAMPEVRERVATNALVVGQQPVVFRPPQELPCQSMTETVRLTIVYADGGEGWIVASIPEVPGALSQGHTDRRRARI